MSTQPQDATTAVAPAKANNAISALARQFNIADEGEVYGIIANTIMPSGASPEQIAAFCIVAAQYGLNPLAKEIYAFPGKGGDICPMVSIDGWLKLLHANPDYAGMEHQYDDHGQWVECTIHSKTHPEHPVTIREYLEENNTNTPVWKQRPMRMLRHRATIQAIRYFGNYAGIYDKDELEDDEAAMRNVTPNKQEPKQGRPSFLQNTAPAETQVETAQPAEQETQEDSFTLEADQSAPAAEQPTYPRD